MIIVCTDCCGSQENSTNLSRAGFVLRLTLGLFAVVAIANWCSDEVEHQIGSFICQSKHALAASEQRYLSSVPQPEGLLDSACARTCGNVSVPYPFGLSRECARNTHFRLECRNISGDTGSEVEVQPGFWPFLATANGSFMDNNATEHLVNSFQVTNINGTLGTMLINTTAIKATSCDGDDTSTFGNASILLTPDGPFRSSTLNVFFVAGCSSQGQYSDTPIPTFGEYGNYGAGAQCGPLSCVNGRGEYNSGIQLCGLYDCCTTSMQPLLEIYLMGGGISFLDFSTCGFCSVVYPESYSSVSPGFFGVGTWGLQLDWALEVNQTQYPNCSTVETMADYACSSQASCSYVSTAGLIGYICRCTRAGFEGDGYLNGTGCNDVDECISSDLNQCAEAAVCTNVVGSYNCTCPALMEGDGFRNSSGCTYIDFCADGEPNDCDLSARCTSLNGHYNCTCPTNMKGDGHVHGTGCKSTSRKLAIIIGTSVGAVAFLFFSVCIVLLWRLWKQVSSLRDIQQALAEQKVQPPFYSYNDLKVATRDFHPENKLGHGAFGAVYKGVLEDGTILGVKKLFNSKQVLSEFLNEVVLITGIKHRNLIQLKGCCIKDRQRILVYEYAENRNVAEALRDKAAPGMLDWQKRFNICVGVARGLSYLHEELQPRIIHRDIKPANILLDRDFNPKIADFGLARPFLDEQSQAQYTQLAGTLGYLAPEYAIEGQLTEKADVFSFGIVVLEIVSGRKCLDYSLPPDEVFVRGWAQKLHKEGRLLDLLQPELRNDCVEAEVIRVINIALICVQLDPIHRATMSQVVTMLMGNMDVRGFLDFSNSNQPDFGNLLRTNKDVRTGKRSRPQLSALQNLRETVVIEESDEESPLIDKSSSSVINSDRSMPAIELSDMAGR